MIDRIKEAISTIYHGGCVECEKQEYPDIRAALQEYAGQQIDNGQALRAVIALEEVRRLDEKFDYFVELEATDA